MTHDQTGQPPQDLTAEQSVLGGMLLSRDVIGEVVEVLAPAAFYRPAHQTVFECIRDLYERDEPADPVTVAAELEHRGQLVRIGGGPYLHTLIETVPVAASAGYYAAIVAEKAVLRRLVEAGNRIAQLGYNGAEGADEAVERARTALTTAISGTEAKRNRLQDLRSALVDSIGLDDIPDPVPLIDGILFADSLAWLYGKPGSGKSFVALDWAGAISNGVPWHGHVVTTGAVLYLVAEGVSGIRRRVRAWEVWGGHPMKGVTFLPIAVQLLNSVDLQALVALAGELQPVLVIIDTQARVTVGADENSNGEMSRVVDAADKIRQASGACVLMVHHSGKNGLDMRGASAFEGAATSIIKITKDADHWVEVTSDKQKDVEDFAPIRLRMTPVGDSVVLTATAADSVAATTAHQNTILDALRQSFGSEGASAKQLLLVSGIPERSFYREVKALVDRGGIVRLGTQARPKYFLPEHGPTS